MDQLKTLFGVLGKFHFWILCSLVLLLYLGFWVVAVSDLQEQAKARVDAIEAAYSSGNSIISNRHHPNDQSAEMMKQLNRAEAEQVQLAWEQRFREQEDVLVWPEELPANFIEAVEPLKPIELTVEHPTPVHKELRGGLRDVYMDYIKYELPKLAEIIGSVWLVSPLDSGPNRGGGMGMGMGMGDPSGMMGGMGDPSGMMMGGMGDPSGMMGGMGDPSGMYGGMGGPSGMMGGMYGGGRQGARRGTADGRASKPIIVAWNQGNQAALQSNHFSWGGTPKTLDILYAQEDLWILRALMLIIKATNGDADGQFNAAVKEILSIDLGQTAAGIRGGGAAGMMGGMMGGMSGMMMGGMSGMGDPSGMSDPDGMMMGMMGGMGGGPGLAGATFTAPDPAENRYVDQNYEPMAAADLRSAMESDAPSDAFLAVAKRMPVRVRFKMNLLRLPLLLSQLASAELPVEVRQVRINCPATPSGGMMGGPGGMMGGMMGGPGGMMGGMGDPSGGMMGGMGDPSGGMMGGMGDPSGGMMGGMGDPSGGMMGGMGDPSGGMMGGYGGRGAGGLAGRVDSQAPYDGTVEIYGIIHLYNPVDPQKLGLGDEADDQPVDPDSGLDEETSATTSGGDEGPGGVDLPPADDSGDGLVPGEELSGSATGEPVADGSADE